MPTKTASVHGVGILRVGTWRASTGPVSITLQNLRDIVAYQGDVDAKTAPIKLGHNDTARNAQLGDGTPAFGQVRNLRVVGEALIGDLTDIPEQLAGQLTAGYPSRSAELQWAVDTTTQKYSARLSGLALLGVTEPAVGGLGELGPIRYDLADSDPNPHVLIMFSGADGTGIPDIITTSTETGHTIDINDESGGSMTATALAKALGLADTASETDMLAAITKLKAEVAAANKEDATEPVMPMPMKSKMGADEPKNDPTRIPVNIDPGNGKVVVDGALLAAIQADLATQTAEVARLSAHNVMVENTAILAAAISDGKMASGSKTFEWATSNLAAIGPARDSVISFLENTPAMFKTVESGYAGTTDLSVEAQLEADMTTARNQMGLPARKVVA